MPKISELKRGQVIDINQIPHAVKTIDCKSPSSRGASTIYKIRYSNLVTGQKLDESYKADEVVKDIGFASESGCSLVISMAIRLSSWMSKTIANIASQKTS